MDGVYTTVSQQNILEILFRYFFSIPHFMPSSPHPFRFPTSFFLSPFSYLLTPCPPPQVTPCLASAPLFFYVFLSCSCFLIQQLDLPGFLWLSKYFQVPLLSPKPIPAAYQFRHESSFSVAGRWIVVNAYDFVSRNTSLSMIF